MKLALHTLLLLLLTVSGRAAVSDYDVVIVGGTPAGITAAIAAAREGKSCVLLERSEHIGGLPVNGLGATDIATRGATAGLFARFVALNKAHYTERYGAGSRQVRDCSDGYHFEPKVAVGSFARMLAGSRSGPSGNSTPTRATSSSAATVSAKSASSTVRRGARSVTAVGCSSTPPTRVT